MFTGLVEALGQLANVESKGGDARFHIATNSLDLSDVGLGDSIAVNGTCLTVVAFDTRHFVADVSVETLKVTTLGSLVKGARVNLEKALLPTTRLGGHLVSGHIDGIAKVLARKQAARAEQFRLRAPVELSRYIAHKGSVCLDGISLTVNAVEGDEFDLTIVPHTLAQTTITDWHVGTLVNLEVDLLARYMERLLQFPSAPHEHRGSVTAVDQELLARSGFMAGSFLKGSQS